MLDFGIARFGGVARETRTGTIVGTSGYMAPEQAQGHGVVDARTDVFTLGCVLFECLTGRAAFVGENMMVLLAKILFEESPRLSELSADMPRSQAARSSANPSRREYRARPRRAPRLPRAHPQGHRSRRSQARPRSRARSRLPLSTRPRAR